MEPRQLSALALCSLLCVGCGAHAERTKRPEMTPIPVSRASPPAVYVARGDFLGMPDVETVRFFLRGGLRDVERVRIDGSIIGAGVAIPDVGRLFAAFGPRAGSVQVGVYRRAGAEVVGLRAYAARGLAGVESWSGSGSDTEPFVGSFEIHGSDPDDGEPYTGSVVVSREGGLYRLRFTTPDGTREATGIVDDDVLAVVGADEVGVPSAGAVMASGDLALVVYRGEEAALTGTTLYLPGAGAPRRGSERLERRERMPRGPSDP